MNTDLRKPSELKPWMDKYPKSLLPDLEKAAYTLNDGLWLNNIDNLYGTAVCYGRHRISFKEMKDAVFCVARALVKIGVHPGEIVTICAPAIPEAIYTIYAAELIGAVVHMLDPDVDKETLNQNLLDTKSRVILVLDTIYSDVQKAVVGTLAGKVIVVSRADSMQGLTRMMYRLKHKDLNKYEGHTALWLDFYYLGMNPLDEMQIMDYSADRTGFLFQSPALDGTVKTVMLSSQAINAAALQFGADRFAQRERTFNQIPLDSSFGFICGIHAPLLYGASVLLLADSEKEELGSFVLKEKPDHMNGFISDYLVFCQSKNVQDADLSFIKSAVCCGNVTVEQEKLIGGFLMSHECPYPLLKVFSMPEMASAILCERGPYNQQGSIGFPLCHTVGGIFEPATDVELDYEETGEICFTGLGLMQGYYHQPEATSSVLKQHRDGQIWFHSGLNGIMTQDGYFYFAQEESIEEKAEEVPQLDLKTIESRLRTHPNVLLCALVAVTDPQLDLERILAFIKWQDESPESRKQALKEIRNYCDLRLPETCRPAKFISVRKFPLTEDGQVDYHTLKKQGDVILRK